MSSKKKAAAYAGTNPQTLKIGSRVRCTDDHVVRKVGRQQALETLLSVPMWAGRIAWQPFFPVGLGGFDRDDLQLAEPVHRALQRAGDLQREKATRNARS